ncbi:sodium-translocating pyrophosphatase [Marinilabilia sp.]|uniref:sodium-translocating pyrophosphatase n=1 Tax=Marinilabilia sp. TaxID=2021252 RepID=UPI0025C42000|nr:sodium-translocating pyrophosphatase [Marinilabilia sp.]
MLNPVFWLVPVASLIALFFAWYFFKQMMKNSEGNDTMKEIARHVRDGANAYLRSQYRVVALVFVVLVILLAVLAFMKVQNPFVPIAFLTGGFFSGLCGYLGMKTATYASARTAEGASKSLNQGLKIAFRSGAVMGLVVVGFGLLDIAMWFWFLNEIVFTPENMVTGLDWAGLTFVHPGITEKEKMVEITVTMLTFGMGASTQALFARVGGGIFTKAADVGADLVGKVEAGIPEDDPRNPATIADNVGDNVGDVAGMGADLYESYCGSILATAALGAALPALTGTEQMQVVMAPMVVAAVGILLSIAGIFLVRTKETATQKNLLTSLLLGTGGSSFMILVALAGLVYLNWITWGIFGSVVVGLLAGVIIGQGTEYFTSDEYAPTKGIARQGLQGPATTIIEGIAVGMFSTWIPVVTIVLGIVGSFAFAGGFENFAMGVYGIGFAAVGMLSTLGITLATDAFGPIADNAGGNAEMSELPPEVRERTDALDMLGNTTAATGKGFAIGSAALTAMALLAAYIEEVRLWLGKLAKASTEGIQQVGDYIFYLKDNPEPIVEKGQKAVEISAAGIRDFSAAYDLSLFNPMVLGGLFIGAMMAFVFSSMTMKAVGRAAGKMVDEVRRQFKEIPGIMERKSKPDYARCVEISTKGAQREMILPSLLAIAVPVVVGLIFGVPGVVGLLAGGLTAGFTLAVMLNNAGGAWDNAKKYIEKGNFGGKNSEAHHAGVVGDTVGDPFKDTSGPSLNILIKLMTMVSVVMAGLTVAFSIF